MVGAASTSLGIESRGRGSPRNRFFGVGLEQAQGDLAAVAATDFVQEPVFGSGAVSEHLLDKNRYFFLAGFFAAGANDFAERGAHVGGVGEAVRRVSVQGALDNGL